MAGSTPEGAASVQRLPEKATLGLEGREVAGGMYQRQTTLERAAGAIFMDFVTAKARKIASSSPFRMETLLATVSVGVQSPGAEARGDAARCASRRQSGEYEYDDKKPERGAATWVAPAQARLARPATLSVAVGAALIFRKLLPAILAAFALEHPNGSAGARVEQRSHRERRPQTMTALGEIDERLRRHARISTHRSSLAGNAIALYSVRLLPGNYGECVTRGRAPAERYVQKW